MSHQFLSQELYHWPCSDWLAYYHAKPFWLFKSNTRKPNTSKEWL